MTGGILCVLALGKLGLTLAGRQPVVETDAPAVLMTASRQEWLAAVGWMTAFFVMLWVVGALITVPLFAAVYLRAVSRQSFIVTGVYALASWAFVYGLFDRVLHVPLP